MTPLSAPFPCPPPPSHLSGNHFTGSLPNEWAAPGAFPALTSLALSSSQMNGSLPRSWGAAGAFPALQVRRRPPRLLRCWGGVGQGRCTGTFAPRHCWLLSRWTQRL